MLVKPKPTKVFSAFLHFCSERQRIFYKRFLGEKPPWTEEEAFQTYKFTNCFREADRASQYLIREILYRKDISFSPEDTVFRIFLYKIFNKPETWELIRTKVGEPCLENFSVRRYTKILTKAREDDQKVFSGAYMMRNADSYGADSKHENYFLLMRMWTEQKLFRKIAEASSMKKAYELALSYDYLGRFLAFQFMLDVAYSDVVSWDIGKFVVAGPGAVSGVEKCFGTEYKPEDIIKWITENQETIFGDHYKKTGESIYSLFGRKYVLANTQNIMCEVAKLSRVLFPDVKSKKEIRKANRFKGHVPRIKTKFEPKSSMTDLFFPPKWGLNDEIKKAKKKGWTQIEKYAIGVKQ